MVKEFYYKFYINLVSGYGRSVYKVVKVFKYGVFVGVIDSVGWGVDRCVVYEVDSYDEIKFGIVDTSVLSSSDGFFDGCNERKLWFH